MTAQEEIALLRLVLEATREIPGMFMNKDRKLIKKLLLQELERYRDDA